MHLHRLRIALCLCTGLAFSGCTTSDFFSLLNAVSTRPHSRSYGSVSSYTYAKPCSFLCAASSPHPQASASSKKSTSASSKTSGSSSAPKLIKPASTKDALLAPSDDL